MKSIEFILDKGLITLKNNPESTQADIAAIAAYCILALAQDNKVLPDEIVGQLLKICKAATKQEPDQKQD